MVGNIIFSHFSRLKLPLLRYPYFFGQNQMGATSLNSRRPILDVLHDVAVPVHFNNLQCLIDMQDREWFNLKTAKEGSQATADAILGQLALWFIGVKPGWSDGYHRKKDNPGISQRHIWMVSSGNQTWHGKSHATFIDEFPTKTSMPRGFPCHVPNMRNVFPGLSDSLDFPFCTRSLASAVTCSYQLVLICFNPPVISWWPSPKLFFDNPTIQS